ncbi:MAG: glycosyltransferase [Xanthobacteraceae bacterium]
MSEASEFAFLELSRIYRSADFFVLNSRSEAFGLPVVEAMACGVPCIIPSYECASATAWPLATSATPALSAHFLF